MTQPRIALVGNLANIAYRTCKLLRRKRVQADVFVDESELDYPTSNPENEDPGVLRNPPDWLKIIPKSSLPTGVWRYRPLGVVWWTLRRIERKTPKHLLIRALRRYDLIASFCLAPWFIEEIGRPYISTSTGSDLRELAMENTLRGQRARSIFQHAEIVFFGPDSGSMDAVRRLRLKSSYQQRSIIDTDFYRPGDLSHCRRDAGELLIFHPTHLDWTYQGKDRWLKHNDRLFRAFARLVKEGHRARLFYLERGPDVEPTRRLVAELGIEKYVETYPGSMTKAQLCHYYNLADVVADQFNISLGLSGLEAMSCGRPVLVSARAVSNELIVMKSFRLCLTARTKTRYIHSWS